MTRISVFVLGLFLLRVEAADLYPRNTEVPFAYLPGQERSWQITDKPLGPGEHLALAGVEALDAKVNQDGRLTVSSPSGAANSVQLEVTLNRPDQEPSRQTLRLIPASPDRPITYLSDLVDDLIRIFGIIPPAVGVPSPATHLISISAASRRTAFVA